MIFINSAVFMIVLAYVTKGQDRDCLVSGPDEIANKMTLKSWYYGHENGGSGQWSICEQKCRDDPKCNSWMGRNSGNTCYLSEDSELKPRNEPCCQDHHPHTFTHGCDAPDEVVSVDCVTVQGTNTQLPAYSQATCSSGYTLVGCNSIGTHPHEVVGSYVSGATCYSSGDATPAKAVARCCKLPACSTCGGKSVFGDGVAVSTCDNGDVLTGCAARTTDVNTGKFRVGAAGIDSESTGFASIDGITPIADQFVVTADTCSASGFTTSTNTNYLEASASCCNLPSNYILECESKWREQFSGATNNYMTCDSDWFMTSCIARNNAGFALDYYYVNSANQCATQMNSHQKQWAQAVCCKLIRTGADMPCACEEDAECPDGQICCKGRKICHDDPNIPL